jgi:hypothetical protein
VESGLVVLDVDPRHGGEETLRAAANGGFPVTLTVITGGGGHHYYFAHPGGNERIKNQQPLDGLPGLDRRGDAGYVLAPPSRHASGRRYEWGDPSALVALTLARCPDWLASDAVNGNGGEPRAPVDVAAALAGVPEGERDDTIFRTACKLRYAGVPEETATDLVVLAASRCTPPFPEATAREKVHRAYGKYPEGKGSAADNGGSPAAGATTEKPGRPRSTAGKYFSSSGSFVPALLADDIQAEHTFVASPCTGPPNSGWRWNPLSSGGLHDHITLTRKEDWRR